MIDQVKLTEAMRARRQHAGRLVQQRRLALGASQRQIAELADVGQATLSRIEAGTIDPSEAIKFRVATALAVATIEELWPKIDVVTLRAAVAA